MSNGGVCENLLRGSVRRQEDRSGLAVGVRVSRALLKVLETSFVLSMLFCIFSLGGCADLQTDYGR